MSNIIKITQKRDKFNFEELQEFITDLEPFLEDLSFLSTIKNCSYIHSAVLNLEKCIDDLKKVVPFYSI